MSNLTMQMRGRPVTNAEAQKSVQRLINSRFNLKDTARCSIPLKVEDDDIVASDYVIQAGEREEELLGMLQLLVDAIELIPGGAVMKRITNEARALLDAAREEKHGTD